jgi:hypothetical protein
VSAGAAILTGVGLTVWNFVAVRQNIVDFNANVRDNIVAAYKADSRDEFKVRLTAALDYLRDTGRDSGNAYCLGVNDIGKWYMELETVRDAVDLPEKDTPPLCKAQSLLRDGFIKGGGQEFAINTPPDIQNTPYVWGYVAWALASISLVGCGMALTRFRESEVERAIRETRARFAAEQKKPKPPTALPAAVPDILQVTHQAVLQERDISPPNWLLERDELTKKLADVVRERDELREKLIRLGLRNVLSVESSSHDKRMSEALADLKSVREEREAVRVKLENFPGGNGGTS